MDMTIVEFTEAVRAIATSSSTQEEICQRVKRELGYDFPFGICVETPTNVHEQEVVELFRIVGGVVNRTGALVSIAIIFDRDVIYI